MIVAETYLAAAGHVVGHLLAGPEEPALAEKIADLLLGAVAVHVVIAGLGTAASVADRVIIVAAGACVASPVAAVEIGMGIAAVLADFVPAVGLGHAAAAAAVAAAA